MLTQKNGAALAGRPTEPQPPLQVLPSIIHPGLQNVNRLATRDEVEEVLTEMWGCPAYTVLCRCGGGRSSYYAHGGSHYLPLDYNHATGFSVPLLTEDEMAQLISDGDYLDYQKMRRELP